MSELVSDRVQIRSCRHQLLTGVDLRGGDEAGTIRKSDVSNRR